MHSTHSIPAITNHQSPLVPFLLPFPPYLDPGLAEVLWLSELELFLLVLAFADVQLHHVPPPGVVEGRRDPDLAVQVLPTGACDCHVLAKERALGADFLVDLLQYFMSG